MLTLVGKVVEVVPNCKSDVDRKRNVGYIRVQSLSKSNPDVIYVEVDGSSPYHSKLPDLAIGQEVSIKFSCKVKTSATGSGVVFNNLFLVSLSVLEVKRTETDLLKI